MKEYYIYILTNKKNGTLYIGMTSNLGQRLNQHKNKAIKGFSSKYNLDKLVYYETTDNAEAAITREKELKKWKRSWKLDLIEKQNPN